MRRFFAFMMIALCAVFPAHAATNTGSFPNDGKMLEDWTYTNAANETNVGVDGGNVNATANYTWNEIALPAGKYLPWDTDALIENLRDCAYGYYCAGTGTNTVHYNQSQNQGLTECPTEFGASADGSTTDTDCYRACDINNMTTTSNPNGTIANIAHAATLTGNDYYGNGNDTCEPATCVTGYHVQAGVGVSLPNGYTELEYIESTGTQYIDTGVVPTLTTGAYVRASFATLNNSDNIIFGASNAIGFAGGKPFAYDPFPSFSYFAFGNFARTIYKVNAPTVANTIYEYELNYMNSGKAKTDTTETTIPTATEMTTRSIFLFGCSYAGHRGRDSTTGARVYRFKISDGTSVVQDLIPAKRNSDNVVGMYDTVSGTFFTNAGTGTFTAGPEVAVLATCEPNTYNITWFDTLAADVTANEAATATYGGNINTPVKIDPAVFQTTQKGKRFIGWTFQQQSNNP